MGAWIDLAGWRRRDHYRHFRRYRHPFFSITAEVDVTGIWNDCRRPGAPSFFLTSLFVMLRAVNGVEALRLRMRPRGVWRHDRVGVGPTIRRPDETFAFAKFDPADTLDAFVASASTAMAEASKPGGLKPSKGDDLVYHSALPWLRFTGFTNALPGNDSIPRIVFGRVVRDGRRTKMPVGVEVHHALVDGADVGRFIQQFDEELARGAEPGARRRNQ